MKKRMLISSPPRMINEIYLPLMRQFAEQFRIVVVMMDFFVPPGLLDSLKKLQEEAIIEKYFVIPIPKGALRFFLTMRRSLERLRSYNFDVWLTHSEKHLEERYMAECILPEKCLRVIFWYNVTFLLKDEAIGRKLLGEELITKEYSKPPGLMSKVKNSQSFLKALQKAPLFLLRPIKRAGKRFRDEAIQRVILPKLFLGKTFRKGPYDDLTQIGSGGSDVLIFCDDTEARAHKALFKNSRVYVARCPTEGFCRCRPGQQKNGNILSPLSGFEHWNRISEEHLFLFYRDYKTVLDQTKASSIDLRLHPDETGRWPYQLENYLKERGLNVKITGCEKPLREIVCDYQGVAGFASGALRDCRAACDNVFIIAFFAISKTWASNPRFSFGSSEGIGWIEENGDCDPDIFKQTKGVFPRRESVFEIVKKELQFDNNRQL